MSTYSSPIEPVTGVTSGAQGQQQISDIQSNAIATDSRWQTALNTNQAVHTYSCYILMIQMLNNLSLDKIDTSVIAESQMMNVEQEIQSKLVDISQFISKIESEATSYAPYVLTSASPQMWSPDAFLGLTDDFYEIAEGGTSQTFGQESVSSDYQASMNSFVSAFKSLFYCNTDMSAPTVASLSTIVNPNVEQGGQNFDLTGLWTNLQSQYAQYSRTYSTDESGNAYSTPKVFNVVSANGSDHASLIQQYMFYKAQLAVDNGNVDAVDGANGDITKLIDLGLDTNGDELIQNLMQGITMFDVSETVARTAKNTPFVSTTSTKVLDLILQEQYNNYSSNGLQPGLYGVGSYMAFNYFWTQASSSTVEENIDHPPSGSGWKVVTDAPGVGVSNDLAGDYTGIGGMITNVGSVTGLESTVMQELIANEGESVNIGQSAVQSLDTLIENLSQNQLSS